MQLEKAGSIPATVIYDTCTELWGMFKILVYYISIFPLKYTSYTDKNKMWVKFTLTQGTDETKNKYHTGVTKIPMSQDFVIYFR